jgi:hypothetical protein
MPSQWASIIFSGTNALKHESLCSPRPDTNEDLFSSTNGQAPALFRESIPGARSPHLPKRIRAGHHRAQASDLI